jgi:DNA-binding NarL/FixJ family response regulator
MSKKDQPRKSVFLAEGETHVREALRLILEHQSDLIVVGEAGNAESLLSQVCQQPPDVILLDWNLNGFHPQRSIAALHQCCPTTLILATSVRTEQRDSAEMLGVNAFLSKQSPPDEFIADLIASISSPGGKRA